MTDEQKVKQRWPDAFIVHYRDSDLWQAWRNGGCVLSEDNPTEAEAWADAARRINED